LFGNEAGGEGGIVFECDLTLEGSFH